MLRWLGLCREVYNAGLQERRDAWKKARVGVSRFDQHKELPTCYDDRPELKAVYRMVLYDALDRIDRTFRAFFRRCKAGEKPGYPRFKGVRQYNSFTYKCGAGFKIIGKRLHLSKIGKVKAVFWRAIPEGSELLTCTLKHEADGWYAILDCEIPLPVAMPPAHAAVGVDLGLLSLVATSDGEIIKAPRLLRKADRYIIRCQRIVARRKKGSGRRRTSVRHLAIAHQHVARQRKAHIDNVVAKLIHENDTIVVEELNVGGLCRSRLARSVHDASWGYLLHALDSKAESAARRVLRVNPNGTSQECPACGRVQKKLLSQRIHRCECGLVCDRDIAAAQVILQRGLSESCVEKRLVAASVKREVHLGKAFALT